MTDADTAMQSPPVEVVITKPIACIRCRNRRTYCSKEHPACWRCRQVSLECVYPEQRKISVSEQRLRRLEALEIEVLALRGPINSPPSALSPATQPQSAEVSRPLGIPAEDVHLEGQVLESFADLRIDNAGKPQTQFIGASSSTSLGRKIRDLIGLAEHANGVFDIDSEYSFYDPAALRPRRLAQVGLIRLPPHPMRLFAAQHTYIGTIFAFIRPDDFERQIHDAYSGPPDLQDRDACLSYAKVLIVLAFGQLYSVNQWTDFSGPPGFEYFNQALQYLPDLHEEGTILFVETLALVGYFLQNLNRRDAAYLYIGTALRMSISLALHQEVPTVNFDEATREHRRRVWWSVYSLDRILSVKPGNPITIQDEDIGVNLPSRLPNEPEYCSAVVLRRYTELSRILGRIMTSIYRKTPKSRASLLSSVQSILSSLAQWKRDVPDELRFEPAKLEVSRESVSTFLHYYQCINMTVRPLLLHLVQEKLKKQSSTAEEDWRDGLHPATISAIETCISAAQRTVTIMSIAAQKNLVATYGYMDGEHAFSAAIILVMMCIAFPFSNEHTSAMNQALDLLQGMADRGNSNLAARYRLLDQVRQRVGRGAGSPEHVDAYSHRSSVTSPALDIYSPISQLESVELGDMLQDTAMGDLGFWEQGYTNSDLDVESGLTEWTGVDTTEDEHAGDLQ